jgi:release factor glutamine methyltransferase
MNVEQALRVARDRALDRLDAMVLLAHHLGQRREWLIAHPEAQVAPAVLATFDADCARRADGVPVAYLTGRREFMGLDLHVSPAVLVPRPETETLVAWALACARTAQADGQAPRMVDLGTGSGAIALALAQACPAAQITAVDYSASALEVARANAARLGLLVCWVQGDWWHAVGEVCFDIAVANPPYIAEGDPHLAALCHEPHDALVATQGGLDALQRIVAGASRHVTGWLLLEHGWDQADAVQRLMLQSGFSAVETRRDLSGQPRCTGGRRA